MIIYLYVCLSIYWWSNVSFVGDTNQMRTTELLKIITISLPPLHAAVLPHFPFIQILPHFPFIHILPHFPFIHILPHFPFLNTPPNTLNYSPFSIQYLYLLINILNKYIYFNNELYYILDKRRFDVCF